MTILIKGMEMPESCKDCQLCVGIPLGSELVYHKCLPLNRLASKRSRRDGCPLVEVPTPHGRLIEADVLIELYEPAPEDVNEWEHYTTTISVIRQNIKDAPTVIEAEEADND